MRCTDGPARGCLLGEDSVRCSVFGAALDRRHGRTDRHPVDLPIDHGTGIGAIGFCFGGLCSLLMARMGLPMRGAISFHGLLEVGAGLDAKPKARMLVLHGQDDPMVPPAKVGAWAEEMKRIGADWQLHAYPGVMHAFTNPAANDPKFGTVYDAGADGRSWASAKAFLAEVFGAASD